MDNLYAILFVIVERTYLKNIVVLVTIIDDNDYVLPDYERTHISDFYTNRIFRILFSNYY